MAPLATGNPTLVLTSGSSGTYKSGIAYVECFQQYYGCDTGSTSRPYEVYDATGALLQTSTAVGIDTRGIWYNPNTGNLEVATYGAVSGGAGRGLLAVGLDGAGLYTGINGTELPSIPGLPGSQSCPAYDPVADLLYGRESSPIVHVVDRQTGAQTGTVTLDLVAAGNPVLAGRSLGFTGVTGYELVAAANDIDAAVLFDLTGAYQATVSLGFDLTGQNTGNYANGQFWVFDNALPGWRGFELFPSVTITAQPGAFHPAQPVAAFDGDTDVVLLQCELTASGGSGQLTGLELTASGSGDDVTGVVQVQVVEEIAGSVDGVLDPTDSVVGTGVYPADDGVLTLMLSTPISLPQGVTVSMLLADDFSATASGAAPPASYEVELTGIFASGPVSRPAGPITGAALVDSLCPLVLCGDCNEDGAVTILDALVAAQHAAGVTSLTGSGFSNCNVLGTTEPDPGATVDVLDALSIAQFAAGLGVTLACCI
jgi:hypothetical protein